ncbi:serine hydrolase domain-containing protein [Luteolibacter sp.]
MSTLHAAPPVMEAVDAKMKAFVEAKEIAGVVTLVADDEKILHLSAVGFSEIDKKTPMPTDAVFWIASMTKPVTATAVMMMQEEGKLSMDDSVAKYLPEFRYLKDAAGNEVVITLKQCLTHSSGLSDLTPEETKNLTSLKELTPVVAAKPVQFPPGSKWQYCQTGINTAARIVEVVSGKSFPEFVQDRLFDPLGMKDTSFYPNAELVARLATSYKRTDAGELEKADLFFLNGKSPSEKGRYPMANGGLFSTATDYSIFARMILRGGEWDGKRYLKEETVKQMTSVQSGDLVTGFTPGNAWGLGWCVVREPQGVSAALSPGSFGHGGLFGTQAWIDPVKKRIYLLFIQRANFTNQGGSDGSDIRRDFQNAAAK